MTNQTPNSNMVNLIPSEDEAQDNFTSVTTEEGKLQQLIEWLGEHIPAYSYLNKVVPLKVSGEDIKKARASVSDHGAHMPDAIIYSSMMVLGVAANYPSPYLAYVEGRVGVTDTTVRDSPSVPVRASVPQDPTESVVVAAHGDTLRMGNGSLRESSSGPNVAVLAARSGAIVMDMNYRLVPEYKVSGAVSGVARVIISIADSLLQLQKLGTVPISSRNPTILYGVSLGDHNAVSAVDQISQGTPVALSLVAPALDLHGAPVVQLRIFFGTSGDSAKEVSPGLHGLSWRIHVHVQATPRGTIVHPATEYLKQIEAVGGKASQSELLATHQVAVSKAQREQIMGAARFILEVTHTEHELPKDPVGEYDKETIDQQDEESWDKN